ncbi:MAG: ribosome biogenesis GTP-binding protein YihA/YsxC, partial [Oscillospiraceae bacterium]
MDFKKADFEAAFGTFSQLTPSDMPEVAFAGRSNVGKSSLLNRIFSRKSLARVSGVPGKTITINFDSVDGARMVDLPGYGYAKVSFSEKTRWSGMLEGYFKSDRDIRLVVQLIDMRHPPTKDDLVMINFLQETGYPFIVVMTKCDKLNKAEYNQRIANIETELPTVEMDRIIPFSAVKGDGGEKIKEI